MQASKVIINADDFGMSQNVNEAVIKSFEMGIISSATIMPNMPAFEEACSEVHSNKLLKNIGIHLNLTDGQPLTENIRRIGKFCDEEGMFCLRKRGNIFYLNMDEKRAVYEELEAQIAECRNAGIPLTHADSHQHIHTEWAVGNIVMPLLLMFKIPYMRLTRNMGQNISLVKKVYKGMFNKKSQILGLRRTQYFGSLDDFFNFSQIKGENPHSCEIMVHPYLSKNKTIIDKSDDSLSLGQKIDKVLGCCHLISFSNDAKFEIPEKTDE